MKNEKQLSLGPVKRVVNKGTYKPGKGTKIAGESETIQNEALNVSELLMKHINGEQIKTRLGGYGADDPEHEDPDVQAYFQMDLAERQDVLEGIREMTNRLKNLEKEWIEEDKKRKLGQKGEKPSGSVPSGSVPSGRVPSGGEAEG